MRPAFLAGIDPSRSGRAERRLGLADHLGERRRLVDRELAELLAVEADVRLLQAGDQAVVGHAEGARRDVDARDPHLAVLALLALAADEGLLLRSLDRFDRDAEEPVATAD